MMYCSKAQFISNNYSTFILNICYIADLKVIGYIYMLLKVVEYSVEYELSMYLMQGHWNVSYTLYLKKDNLIR